MHRNVVDRFFRVLGVLVAGGLLIGGLRAQAAGNPGTDQIPTKVMDALKTRFLSPAVTKWTKEKEEGVIIYDIEFTQGGRKCEADFKGDGTLLNWERAIAAKNLPAVVTKSVEARYTRATLGEVMEVTVVKGGKEELEGYEISLKTAEKKDVEVTVAPDGKILEDSGTGK